MADPKTDPKAATTPVVPRKGKPFESDKKQHNGARYSPCGKYLLAGGYTGQVYRWDVTGDEPKALAPVEGHHGWVQALAFAPRGEMVFTGDSWGRLRAWSYVGEKPQMKWDLAAAHDGWLRDVDVSRDGTKLVTCGRDQTVRVWDAATGKKLHEFVGHNDDVLCVVFGPDGKSVLSGDLHGSVRQWDLASGKVVRTFDASSLFMLSRLQDTGGPRVLRFSTDGKTLLVAGTKPSGGGTVQGTPTVIVFDAASAKETKRFELGVSNECFVQDVQYHAQGFWMAAISGTPGSGKFVLLRLNEDKPFHEQKVGNCHALSVRPDGACLVATLINAGSNGNGRVKGAGPMEYPGNYSPLAFFDIPAIS